MKRQTKEQEIDQAVPFVLDTDEKVFKVLETLNRYITSVTVPRGLRGKIKKILFIGKI